MGRPPLQHPPSDLRRGLAEGRQQGLEFQEAWDLAYAAIAWPTDARSRRDWREALAATAGEWRAAFEGQPTPLSRAAAVLADFDAPPAVEGEMAGFVAA